MEAQLKRKDIPSQRRQQILAAAAELFSQSGYHGVTVDAIARRAGISKGNLYWHFRSKQEIFQHLADYLVGRLFSPLADVMLSDAPPPDRLRAMAERCLDAAQADPEAVRIMWQVATQPELKELLSSGFSSWIRPFIDYLSPLFAEMGEKDPQAVAMLYAFTLDCLMIMSVVGPDVYDRDKLMAALADKFLGCRGGKDV